ncbi:FabD/lysophospholipase-like protein [Rhizodiscina lignyota]|uniref:FabD/lysophospholipase-like protein n=1 Tax=Rhizodiscina lignyota TaxID=1504668 RepID=A0A9P4IME4_9PEZI|nr:FabD/lysophospholipase-like protein [Rhizodiscina lignyota]
MAGTGTNSPRPSSIITPAPRSDEIASGIAWAREVKDPWDPSILTLDGGGIRGYSSLLIIKALMVEIAKWENKMEAEIKGEKTFDDKDLLPCHYFDYMYGTSTGGLIATMLARLRMPVDECLEIYRQVGNDLFGTRRSRIPLTTKYYHEPLERAVKRITTDHCPLPHEDCDGEDYYPWHPELDSPAEDASPISTMSSFSVSNPSHHICQAICLTATHNQSISEAYLLRTYPHRYVNVANWITLYNEGADPLKIWQVTRATSAAPFYFEQLEAYVRGELKIFKDGGIRENNPSGAAWSEFVSLYGERRDPALLLSIGTGRPNQQNDGFAAAWPAPFGRYTLVKKWSEKMAVFRNLLVKYTEGERQHRAMMDTARGQNTWYKRLNVCEGLQTMKLDNWERGEWKNPLTGEEKVVVGGATLTRMEKAVENYLTREFDHGEGDTYAPPKVMLEQAAEKLVRQRRARERSKNLYPKRWETFMGEHLHREKPRGEQAEEASASIAGGAGDQSAER